jgi:hypothetical protein
MSIKIEEYVRSEQPHLSSFIVLINGASYYNVRAAIVFLFYIHSRLKFRSWKDRTTSFSDADIVRV